MTSAELTEWIAFYDLRANPPPKVQTPAQVRTVLQSMVARGPFERRKKR